MYRSLFVWNASQLVQAAINAKGRPLTLPIDRDGGGASSHQYPAVTPARYDTGSNGQLFGWIYGVGAYASQQATPSLTLQYLPELQQLAPSVFEAARTAAAKAQVPVNVPKTTGDSTFETFAVRTIAQLISLGSYAVGAFQAAVGADNAEMMAQWDDAQAILNNINYDTKNGGVAASFAKSVEGALSGMTLLSTDFIGILARDTALLRGIKTGVTPEVPTPTEFLQLLSSNPSMSETINYLAIAALKYNPLTLGAETVYRMTSAALEKNWEELRNASFDLFVLGALSRWGETPAGKREIQLKTKQVDFLKQQTRGGVIERSVLEDLTKQAKNSKEYVIESPRTDVNGVPISEGRILTTEEYARAAEGCERQTNADGSIEFRFCFAAGTLVHTDQGLVPIEQIGVGTKVLSQPEQGGERALRSVVKTVSHRHQRVLAVQVKLGEGKAESTIFATLNHPFWVDTARANGEHWLAAECLEPGMGIQLADGRSAEVGSTGLVRHTQYEDILFAADDRVSQGQVLCLKDGRLQPASAERLDRLEKLRLGEAYLSTVYNFEVQDFHTYYVAEAGVWVHNTNCTADAAIEQVMKRAEETQVLEEGQPPCFAAGTLVHTREGLKPIEDIQVGDWVLSFPDDQAPPDKLREEDDYAYKQVTRLFVTEDKALCRLIVVNLASGDKEEFLVTPEHPIYCKGRGWVPASKIRAANALENYLFGNLLVFRNYQNVATGRVYNFEVEDYHTYYVGKQGVWVHNTCGPEISKFTLSDLNDLKPRNRVAMDYVDQGQGQSRISPDSGQDLMDALT